MFVFITESYSQFYFFGRNKVTYEDFDWKVLKTDHFDIYYYGEFVEIAEIGADIAEEAFEEYKVKFNNIVNRRIPLVFYNTHLQFQQTNITPGFIPEGVGGFFEFLKGRVVIPYMGSIQQFKHVIRHELVHVFMDNTVYNIQRNHRTLSPKHPPLWFVEGLAEYWSYHWDTQAEMLLRDAILNDYFVPLKDFYRFYGSFLMYKEGQKFLEFVAENYGEEKILLMMENMWRFESFYDVIEYTLGEKIDEIDEKFTYSLKKKYYPLYENKQPLLIGTEKITKDGFNFSPAVYKTNDTTQVYFVANKDGYTSVYRLSYNEKSKKWSDLEKIVQGEKEEIFESFHLLQLSLDVADNGMVAFVTKSGATDAVHIYSIENDKVVKTLKYPNLLTIKSPKFSNDKKKIIFNATDVKGYSDLFIADLESEKLIRVTNDYYDDIDPVFGKGDSTVVFASDRTEGYFEQKYNLFEINLNTFDITYLTYVNADIKTPHFSPDFSELYFNSDYDGVFNIWKLEYENSEPSGMTQLSNFITSVYDFNFIDDTKIITSAFEKLSFQFYEMDLAEVPDSTMKYVHSNFKLRDKPWQAPKIVLDSEDDRLVYEKKYSLDYAVGQFITGPNYGERAGALFSLSDLLGDDRYHFLFYNSAEIQNDLLRNINIAITRVNFGNRTNYAYGVFHFNGRRYDLRVSDDYYYEREFGGFVSMIYPFSFFKRIELSTTLSNSDRDVSPGFLGRKALLLSNTISYVHDNSIWGPTGPLDGSRYRVLLGYTSDIKYSNVNYYSFVADYRHYFRLGFRSAVAARASLYYNEGKDATRYIAGGSWDLRGWPRWGIRGEKLWLSSIELRYPLIDELTIRFPFLGLSFSSLRGAVYFDAGSAWDDDYTETLGSIGTGIRFNLFNAIVLRYDIGKKIEKNFTQFQPKLFYQFFFGWDF